MHLTAPVYQLKRSAKRLAREAGIPLHAALNRIAAEEGFQSWSHLASFSQTASPATKVLSRLDPGDLVLLAARPGHGKTCLSIELIAQAARTGRRGFFFTLDYNERDVEHCVERVGLNPSEVRQTLVVDTSDDISARYIIERINQVREDAVVVIDYLQLLDQKRTNPSLAAQIQELQAYAKCRGTVLICISQVDRVFDLGGKSMPGLSDIRLPNPLDLALFDRYCFMHEGKIHLQNAA